MAPARPAAASVLGLAFTLSPAATVVLDAQLRILVANPAFGSLCGQRPSELVGTRLRLQETPFDVVPQAPAAAGSGGAAERIVTLARADGSLCTVRMVWARAAGPAGSRGLHVASFVELDPREDELQRWRHRAWHDALTGLPNRACFSEELDRGIARAARHFRRLAILFIDLDGFKAVNDRCGHAAGDRLLSHVGACLRGALRAEDVVARYAGDEFAVMIEAPRRLRDATTAAQTVLGALARGGADPAGAGHAVTASIGIALYPDHAVDAAGLLQVADAAMYRAKRNGGNAVQMGSRAQARAQLSRQAA